MKNLKVSEKVTHETIRIHLTNLNSVLSELKIDILRMDCRATELELNAKKYIMAHGNDYERPEDIKNDICRLRTKSTYLNSILAKIEEAVKKDRSTELRITYKNQGDSNEE